MSSNVKNFIAIDIGASNGRIYIGRLEGYSLSLEEAHRFKHSIYMKNDVKYWDWKFIQDEIDKGLIKACKITGKEKIESICCNSWSQDFGLLDTEGKVFYEPVSYRDNRTEGLPYKFSDAISPLELLKRNGSTISKITTLCQLYSMVKTEMDILKKADKLLFIADLINYKLCGVLQTDSTFATASQMYNLEKKEWDYDLLSKLGIPERILPPILEKSGIVGKVSFPCHPKLLDIPVIAGSGHDTSLASLAIYPMKSGTLFMSLGTWAMIGCCCGGSVNVDKIDDISLSIIELAGKKWALFDREGIGMWPLHECMKKWATKGMNFTFSELSDAAFRSRISSTINLNKERFFSPNDMTVEIYNECLESGLIPPENPGDFAKVIFDSLIQGFKKSIDKLTSNTEMQFDKITIVGGGSKNKYIASKISEVLGIPVAVWTVEATVVGSIILQAKVLKVLKSEEEFNKMITRSFSNLTYK